MWMYSYCSRNSDITDDQHYYTTSNFVFSYYQIIRLRFYFHIYILLLMGMLISPTCVRQKDKQEQCGIVCDVRLHQKLVCNFFYKLVCLLLPPS